MVDRPILNINNQWRIAHDGIKQWVLQRQIGSQWHGKKFNTTRENLLRSIMANCDDVDPDLVKEISHWPDRYKDWLNEHFPIEGGH